MALLARCWHHWHVVGTFLFFLMLSYGSCKSLNAELHINLLKGKATRQLTNCDIANIAGLILKPLQDCQVQLNRSEGALYYVTSASFRAWKGRQK
jgi:hypothetical protein